MFFCTMVAMEHSVATLDTQGAFFHQYGFWDNTPISSSYNGKATSAIIFEPSREYVHIGQGKLIYG